MANTIIPAHPRSPEPFRRLFGETRVLWQNISGAYVSGLVRWCPVEAVVCPDDGGEFDLISARYGLRFWSLEERTGVRTPPLESAVEQLVPCLESALEEIVRHRPKGSWAIVCPRPCRTLSRYATERGYRASIHPTELGQWLYDKANFFAGLDQLGLPRLPGFWTTLASAQYSELSAELGARFVVQLPDGSGGSGTAFVFSRGDFLQAGRRFGAAVVWAAPYRGNLSVNINAVAMARGVVTGYPSVQLVGLNELHCGPGVYCGNDFAAAAGLPRETLEDIEQQTERIGQWLSSLGYRGLYGLDFLIDPDSSRAYAVDLNPRWQGSTMLSTQAEQLAGRLPLAAAEIAYRLGVLGEEDLLSVQDDFRKPLVCSQMILHSEVSGANVEGHVLPGIYGIGSRLTRIRDGFELDGSLKSQEFLVTCSIVRRGRKINHGACLGRILSSQAAFDVKNNKLLPWAHVAAKRLSEEFRIETVPSADPQRKHPGRKSPPI